MIIPFGKFPATQLNLVSGNNIFNTKRLPSLIKLVIMKKLKTVLLIAILVTPFLSYGQSTGSYKKRTYKKTTIIDTAKGVDLQKNPVIKENAPVLNDNGNVNSSGSVEGNRSSTGRPGADTTGSYVRKRKRTITTGGVIYPDTTRKKSGNP